MESSSAKIAVPKWQKLESKDPVVDEALAQKSTSIGSLVAIGNLKSTI